MSVKFLVPIAFALSGCAVLPPPIQTPEPLPPAEEVQPEQWAATCEPWDDWDKPAPPYRIFGSTYYVGTCGISAILIAGDEGHILIDSGTEEGAQVVMDNIQKLGFRLNEIASILHSHEHFDHVGGLAKLRAATGAHIVSSAEAAKVLSTGEDHPEDPQFGVHEPMDPVQVDVIVEDGDTVRTETATVTAHATPGHSPGALSWTWVSCSLPGEPPACSRMAYVDSLSAVSSDDYRFTDHPEVVAAFRTSIDKVRSLPCDILLTPHPSSSQLIERLRTGTLGAPGQCATYAAQLDEKLDERLAKENP